MFKSIKHLAYVLKKLSLIQLYCIAARAKSEEPRERERERELADVGYTVRITQTNTPH